MNDALRTYVFALAAFLLTLALLKMGAGILIPLAVAGVVWYIIDALASVMIRLHLPRGLRTLIASALIIAALIAVFDILSDNIADVVRDIPRFEARLVAMLSDIEARLPAELDLTWAEIVALDDVQLLFQNIAASLAAFLGNLGLVIAYVLFLALSRETFGIRLERAIPDQGRLARTRTLIQRAQRQIKAYLWAKTLMSLLTAAISALVLALAGLDYVLFWAFWIFLLNFVPYIGSALGVLLPTLLALVQFDNYLLIGSVFTALTATQLTIDNIVEPQVMGKTLNIDPLVVIVALVLWGYLWGMIGVFLAIPLTAILIFLFYQFPGTRWIAILLSRDGDLDWHHQPGP
ncbi:MAG: AI-2E family transporter [Rhodothalassiaceae bacterium]